MKPVTPKAPHFNLKPGVTVFVDGAARNNGKPNARAGIGVYFGPQDKRNISARLHPKRFRPTNQCAELVAAIRGIQASDPTLPLCITTDSEYVVKGMNEWRIRWKAKNWTQNLVNRELWKQLSDLVDERGQPVTFQWVKGHGTCEGNKMADKLATAGANMKPDN